jgi:hypothetical protein
MKFIILFISFLIFPYSYIIAQNKSFDVVKPPNNLGIEVGPSLTQYIHNKSYDMVNDFKIGYIGGVFFQYNFNSLFSIYSSISYEKKLKTAHMSFFNTATNENELVYWSTYYDYITIPFLGKYTFKKHKFFFDIGPYFNTLLMSKSKHYSEISNYSVIGNITKDLRSFIFGFSSGIGAKIPFNKKIEMSFEIRDDLSLTRIDKDNNSLNPKTSFNSVLFLYSITYHFPEKKKKLI